MLLRELQALDQRPVLGDVVGCMSDRLRHLAHQFKAGHRRCDTEPHRLRPDRDCRGRHRPSRGPTRLRRLILGRRLDQSQNQDAHAMEASRWIPVGGLGLLGQRQRQMTAPAHSPGQPPYRNSLL